MQPVDRNIAYLWDMLDAARSASHFISGLTFEDYQRDRKVQLAVERAVEIIGEAARRISEEFRSAHSENTMAQHDSPAQRSGARVWRNPTRAHVASSH